MHDSKNQETCQTLPLFAVYVIWCRITNMHYVGVTGRKVEQRICEHKRKKHQHIDCEIQRLGWEGNYDWWIVEEHVPADQISDCEQKWVGIFDCVFPKGYNKTCGGIKFFKHTEETKAQMRNRRHTEEEKAKISKGNRGKKRTEEQRANIRNSHLGKKLTEEHIAKIAKGNRGKKRTQEFKENLRQARLGKKHNKETKEKMSAKKSGENHPMHGKHHTSETKAIMRESHLGKEFSEEHKAKLREKALERGMSQKQSFLRQKAYGRK